MALRRDRTRVAFDLAVILLLAGLRDAAAHDRAALPALGSPAAERRHSRMGARTRRVRAARLHSRATLETLPPSFACSRTRSSRCRSGLGRTSSGTCRRSTTRRSSNPAGCCDLEHLTYFLAGVLMWWPVVARALLRRRRRRCTSSPRSCSLRRSACCSRSCRGRSTTSTRTRPQLWGLSDQTDQQIAGRDDGGRAGDRVLRRVRVLLHALPAHGAHRRRLQRKPEMSAPPPTTSAAATSSRGPIRSELAQQHDRDQHGEERLRRDERRDDRDAPAVERRVETRVADSVDEP